MKSAIDLYVMAKVKEKRIRLGISQAKLAAALNISVGFIGMVESENYSNHYNLKHLNEIAKIFKCSPKDLLPTYPI